MSNLMRYDPLDRMQRSIDRLLDWAWSESPWGSWDSGDLPLDVLETSEALIVKASLPGFEEKDIDVSVKGDWLKITAKRETERRDVRWHIRERHMREYHREIKLPEELKGRYTSAELENGVLTVKLPKTNPGPLAGIKIAVKKALPKLHLPQLGAKANVK